MIDGLLATDQIIEVATCVQVQACSSSDQSLGLAGVNQCCWLMTGILSATTNGGDDGNLASVGDGARESTRIPDVFVTDEKIDVLPHLALLRCDAIPNARIDYPERRQRLSQSLR